MFIAYQTRKQQTTPKWNKIIRPALKSTYGKVPLPRSLQHESLKHLGFYQQLRKRQE